MWDEDLVRLFARESAQTYRKLIERGVRFSRFIPRPRQHSVDRMAAVEDAWMFRRAFLPDFERAEGHDAVPRHRASGCSRTATAG